MFRVERATDAIFFGGAGIGRRGMGDEIGGKLWYYDECDVVRVETAPST